MISNNQYEGQLKILVDKAIKGYKHDIDFILSKLNNDPTLVTTRYVDFALSLVENDEGIKRIKFYLFNGSQIQRNYASLYFNRLDEWQPVKEAYEMGLIDEIQAFAR